MHCWLFKEEPRHYSFENLQMDGSAVWDGVKNNLALKNLRQVRTGDVVLYYHTGDEKQVVGIAVCVEEAGEGKYPGVRIKAKKRLRKSIPLADIKSMPEFRDTPLVRMPRLSVMPVGDEMLYYILARSETTLD